MRLGEEGGGIEAEVVPLGPEVVVDDVEEHREPARVSGVDQGLQVLRPAIGRLGGEGQHAVVAPAPAPREIGNRHQLERGHPEGGQVVEPGSAPGEGTLGGERSDV